jgi:hypothetical protein
MTQRSRAVADHPLPKGTLMSFVDKAKNKADELAVGSSRAAGAFDCRGHRRELPLVE